MQGDSKIGIATRLMAGRFGVLILVGSRDFLVSKTSRPALELNQFPMPWVPGVYPGIKRLEREPYHSASFFFFDIQRTMHRDVFL